ncbi:MAG: phenylalanine--tRNA ligase subunit beta [Thermotogae bacterium]|nr:phenylalanine--tRNA ligase subunit beta [Thermotogota bacterium]
MKVSLEWLDDYVDISGLSVNELVESLSLSGTSVEEVIRPWEGLDAVFGKILEITPHPDADRLLVCRVGTGENEYRLVTGDLSLKVGDVVAVARPGSKLFGGLTVEARTIRGVESQGTMLSLEELGLEIKSKGVWKAGPSFKVGVGVKEELGLDDVVLDLEITPNRPDELSHIGVAREISVLFKRPLNVPKAHVEVDGGEFRRCSRIVIEDSDGCYRYAGTIVHGIEVYPSPLWLRKRLVAVGVRPINSVVDITNYVMLEYGHPIHAFDFDRIPRKTIVVKRAKGGERVELLDERQYTLEGGEVLITDGEEILALGGIMGAMGSGVEERTKNLLVEVAYFNPVRIRRASKSLKLVTDASYRFERGVDPNDTLDVMDRVVSLLKEISGGSSTTTEDVYVKQVESKKVVLRLDRARERLGMEITEEEAREILTALGFDVAKKEEGKLIVVVPTFRPDVTQECDLIEEIGRIHGYEDLQPTPPKIQSGLGGFGPFWKFKEVVSHILRSFGFNEGVTFSMVDFGDVEIQNPLTSEMTHLRSTLVFGLLQSLAYNWRQGERNIRLFEQGRVFFKDESTETGVKERTHVCFMATGRVAPEDYGDKREFDLLYLKGVLEEILHWAGITHEVTFEVGDSKWQDETKSLIAVHNGRKLAELGRVDPTLVDRLDVKDAVYACELDLELLWELKRGPKPHRELPSFPSIRRDLSVLIKKSQRIGDLIKTIREIGGEMLERVQVEDLYEGKGIPRDARSVLLSLTFRHLERTLTDEEVNELMQEIVKVLQSEHNVQIRGLS